MRRSKRVFNCFLCILLILTQPISALALEKAISEPEKDIKYCETEEFDEYKSDNSKIENLEEIENILEPGENQDIIDDKIKENEQLDNVNETDDSDKIEEPAESIKQDDSEETKENEGMSDEEESERDVELEDPIEDNITDKEQNKDEQELFTENEETDGNKKTNEGEELSEDEEVTEADKTDHINWYLKQGENASEYQISNAKELLGLAELVNGTAKDAEDKLIAAVDFSGKCITLTDDIDLSEVCHPAVTVAEADSEVEEVSWQPIGTSNTQFKGVFDGRDHTISGLYINSNKTHLGLFGYINDAKIQNLAVEGSVKYTGTAWSSYVSGVAAYVAGTCELEGLTSNVALDNPSDNTGGIAAYISGASKISRCINHGVIHSDDSYVGGILGRGNSSDAVISNCYVTADIKGKYDTGAIVGRFSTSATLRDCFYYNPGGGMTIADSGSPVNCYYFSDASIEGAKGVAKGEEAFRYGEVAYLLNGRSAHRSNWAQGKDYPIFGDENTEPLYRVSIAPHAKDSIITFEFIDLDKSLHPISEGNGGKSLYVPKDTRISIKFSGGTPCLMPEGICIPDESQDGVYYIEVSGEDAVITYGTVEELTQPTLSWYSKDEVTYTINMEPELRGLELLVNNDDPKIRDDFKGKTVILGSDIELSGQWKPIGKDKETSFKGTFDGNGHTVSGLKIGSGSSAEDGAVEGNYQGFFGYTQGTIKDLTVTGSVYGKGDYIGGIVGCSTGTIDKCSFGEDGGSSDCISGGNYVGGVVGYASGSITSSNNYGTVVGVDQLGGIVGYTSGSITSGSNSGTVVGEECVGGIVGYASSTSKDRVKDNINSGHISGNKDVGGIAGHSNGGVSGNKNHGNVQGLTNIGGIVGFSNRTYAGYLLQNTNTGEIKGEGNNIGGIVGYTRGPISGGANSGDITGNSNVGGIVGNLENKTEVLNSYSTGKVTVTNEDGKYGLLVGADSNGSSIKNSYSYNTEEPHISLSGSENTAVIDSYYLVSDGYDGDDKAAKTAEQFKSGEVAWLLDGGENTRETTAWTQDDGGNYPVLGEKPIFRIKIAEGESVKGCSLMIGAGGLTEPLTYVEMNPENPSETCEWKLVYVRSEEELHFTTHIDKDYEVVFTPPLELKKTDKDYILKVDRNYTGCYTFGAIVLPDYSWYSGPEAKEYTLSNEAHLVALGELVNGTAVIDGKNIPAVDFAGKVINLEDNIDLKTGNWKAIGKKDTPFKGIFDGQTHSISSLNINAVSDNQGLFGYIEDATIKNLSVNGVVNSTGKNIGGIAGFASGKCHFENLSFGSGVIGGNSELPGEGSDAEDVTGEESSNEDFGENDENKPNEGELAEDNFDKEELGEGNISEEVLTEASADEAPSGNDESKPTEESSSEKESGEGKEPGNENSKEPGGEIPENPGDDNENGNTEPVKASSVSGAKAIGGILGAGMFSENSTDESMTFINCINHGAISGTDTETGGIVGHIYHASDKKNAKIVLKDCKNHGTIEGCGDYTAGIAARVGSGSNQYLITKITDDANDGNILGKGKYTAGIVGYIVSISDKSASENSSISNCVNNGTIIGDKTYTAGIAAYILNYVEVIDCGNTGIIENYSSYNSYTGGVLGYAESWSGDGADIVRCYNRGAVTGKDSYTAGVAGSLGSNTSIRDCKNEGKIVGKDYTGGISGNFTGRKLEKCYNLGRVEGVDRTGGVVGCFKGDKPLSTCFNDGDIIGTDRVGGIVGKVETSGKGIVISCYNTGSISGTGSSAKAGGIIGENHFSRSGGSFGIPIVSKTESGASNCYNHGKVVSSGKVGAITAAYYNMNDNCYYRKGSVSNPVDYKNATAIDGDELASGKVAWILNGGAGKRIDSWSQQGGLPVIAGAGMGPTYKVYIKASNDGKVDGSSYAKNLYRNAGNQVKLSITPEEGYLLKLLTVDGYNTGENYFSISNIEEIEFEMPSEDVVITPIFGLRGLEDEYTVAFIVDSKKYDEQTVKNGGIATEPKKPVKEGYDFDGWYTDEAGGQKWNFATAVTENVTLYAHWRVAGMVEVTFDANGGHFSNGSETTVINIKNGEKIIFPEDPERNGEKITSPEVEGYEAYIFDGWYTDRLREHKIDEKYIVREDMTCFAHWKLVDKFSLGTEEEPFVINSPEVLRELASRVNDGNSYKDCYFQLARGVDWVLTDWTPIGETSEFRGNFDGNGVTIKLEGSAGLFGILTKVKIKNFTLEADIHGGNNTGAVASTVLGQKAREFSEFKDITVRGKVSGNEDVGGFVGLINANYWSSYYENSVSFENCHNKATVTGNGNRVGGFVGTHYSHSIYRECSNSGEVTGASGVGGLDGYAMYVTIEDTHNTGKIVGSGDNVGGLIGAMGVGIWSGEQPMNAIFTNSYNTGNIEGNNNIGGLFGGAGLVGYGNAYGDNTGTLIQFTQCYNTGSITGTNRVAGIVGYMNPFKNAVLEECYNNGKISGKDYTAGIFGDIAQGAIAVKDCYNEGKIIGNDYAAGIFGRSSRGGSTVEDCYNIGSVEGAKYTAGIFGYSNSVDTTVKDCYNRGDISGSEYVAGIYGCIEEGSGSNETTAIYCYASGKIKGAGGAIAGGNYEKNANCYYMEGNIKNPADAKYAIAETAEDFLLGEVAYLLDGGEGERRGKWTQDKEVDLPKLGTPPYYKIELESNEGGCIDIDGHTKMFAPSGEVIKINAICQDHPKNDDSGEMQYKYILESLTVSFAKGEELDITDNKSFTMLSSDAKVTAVFKPQEVAPVEPPVPEPTPEPEKPQEPEKGIGGGDGTGTGRGKGKKTGDGYGDGGGNGDSDGGSIGYGEGKGNPTGEGTSEIEAVESVKTDTTIITPPSAPKVTSNDIDTVPPVNIVADVKQSHNDQAGQEYNKSSKGETDSLTASGSPGPDLDANEPKELEEEEEEEKIKVFEIVKKVIHENPILVVIVIASIIGLLFSGGLRAYSTIKRRR